MEGRGDDYKVRKGGQRAGLLHSTWVLWAGQWCLKQLQTEGRGDDYKVRKGGHRAGLLHSTWALEAGQLCSK